VLDLKKNLTSIFAMEDKGFKVAFIDGKVRIWQRNPKDAFTLGFRVEGLYQVGGSHLGALTCDTSLQFEYGTEDLLTIIIKPYLGKEDGHRYARVQHES